MAPITSLAQLDLTKTYSYADYLTWQVTELVELVKGRIWKKSPAPKVMHQRYVRRILTKIDNALAGQRCEVFVAPFDVRLTTGGANGDQHITTVVQPDICVVCDPEQLDERGCLGAPVLVVEILSASTMAYDTKVKFDLYEESGVAEYWIVSPGERAVAVYVLRGAEYQAVGSFYEPGLIPCHTLPDLGLDWKDIFEPAGKVPSV
jgi:Uma2 family endonuclease